MEEITFDRNKLHVCERCLMGIECHEGRQRTLKIYPEWDLEDDDHEIVCDWCEEWSEVLYEIG